MLLNKIVLKIDLFIAHTIILILYYDIVIEKKLFWQWKMSESINLIGFLNLFA